ncbi:MAG: proliferating cell nuclear antigen (pcna) [Candidatus Aenigmarchaeota archaeon]|nr:proliferating cell nuclear antigen (pcna) [Candidatus Aenigmarchaeota archaeon]
MFRVSTYETTMFKDVFDSISKLVEEGVIKLEKDKGLIFTAADKALISVIRLNILPIAFEEFEVEKESIGVNLDELKTILKRGTKKDKLVMYDEAGKLVISFENSARRKFTMPILTLTEEELPNIDALTFKARAEIASEGFKRILDDAKQIADEIEISTNGNKIRFYAIGELSSLDIEIERGQDILFDLQVEENSRARYPLDYLVAMSKVAKVADTVIIQWATDYPIKLTFKETDKMILDFVVAPRATE